MRTTLMITTAIALAFPAIAADKRELDAHEHGVGALNIAVEGGKVLMELEAPGADIVGFEHPAKTPEDKAKIDAAIKVLEKPTKLFAISNAAGCNVVAASAALIGDEHHREDHGEDHGEHDHSSHDDHAGEDAHHDDHAAEDDHHDEHSHDEHHHDDHAQGDAHHDHDGDEANHTEFHAEYVLACSDVTAISDLGFPYFDLFPNAQELEIQMISEKGTNGFEVDRDQPTLTLDGLI
ncbi:MAG: DUF2796 domain-containing protein [Pseudomonadota bacterium]